MGISPLVLCALLVAAPGTPVRAGRDAQVEARKRLHEGEFRMSEDRFREAAKAFEAAIALDPLLIPAHYALGTARMGLKEYAAAAAAFEAAREAFLDPVTAGNRIETDLARQRRIRSLQAQLSASSGAATAQGVSQESAQRNARQTELRDLMRSQEESDRIWQLPPGLSLALGSAYFRMGRLADAEREYRTAIEAQPKLGEAHNNLAVVLLMTGHAPEAKEQLTLAEKNGFTPSAGLKADVEAAMARASPAP
jgi:tetratricopeptide (TPR) repeat protein